MAHTLYLLLTRHSFDAWDTVEEFVALARVSKTDTRGLKNVSAGIRRFKTMGLNTRIRTVDTGTQKESLELLVGEAQNGLDGRGQVEKDVKYGNEN